ncbi:MAG: hypothetical protein ACK55I_42440, partial [bacterium]
DALAAARLNNRLAAFGELIRITSSVKVTVASIAPESLNRRAIRFLFDLSLKLRCLLEESIKCFA